MGERIRGGEERIGGGKICQIHNCSCKHKPLTDLSLWHYCEMCVFSHTVGTEHIATLPSVVFACLYSSPHHLVNVNSR